MTPSLTARHVAVAAFALSALALLAPGSASADAAGKSASAKNSAAQAPMTAAPMKSNGSGIAVQYRIDGTPEAGVAVPVVLTFDGVTDPAGGSLRLTSEGGLSFDQALATSALPRGQLTTITVNVVPAAAGIAYLHVFTTQNGATSATSVPIQVGKAPAALPSAEVLKQDAAGEKVRSMQVK